ncbi:cysteine-rich receptor-like protein kinase 15 isoform X2 [Spinacia oleracea]|uniref:Cysteine-rich receptor-like protein kinase 15 isoform X2 n=1 Tax=Spinacia oleracea TaxID=3562 RepID=A0ABM3QW18_SPIOL|nr:cysteine-rich receptor-like protein kinase 15 isoform X2 [Spinacia oleracea]
MKMISSEILSYNLFLLLFYSLSATVITSDHLFTSCPATESANYTANSPFEHNLKAILNSLPSKTSISGFYNGSIGSNSNKVYAQALCRGDVLPSDCKSCVQNASFEIFRQCQTIEATIWFDSCQVRYSYYMFFNSMTYAGKYKNEDDTVNNPAVSSAVLSRLMHKLSVEAAYNSPGKMFSVGNAKVSEYMIYGLVQCTRDISPSDCSNCLIHAFGDLDGCCSLHQGGTILSFSCNMRFEAYRFYNATAVKEIFVIPIERRSKTWVLIMGIGVPTLVVIVISAFCAVYYCMRKKAKDSNEINQSELMSALTIPKDVVITEEGNLVSTEGLPFMDLATLKDATDNFSGSNLLGQGGFGAVYEGCLPDGTKLAVKKLARRTSQGAEDLKNEIMLMANLQHRNLVKLLGCGIEGQEKILVYELLPHKSLDLYIYEKRADLNWEMRFNIINGIARGLLYLHDGSRIRIIHRDLKPSNILLDQDMIAKISDFGIARIFCDDQNSATTKRVVGTYGYMAPEYAMEGLFSVKSDVFSFGVIVLEIISGIRSSRYFKDHSKSLVAYAWKLWNEGKDLDFVDSLLGAPCSIEEVLRCLHIALLCVQEDPAERPAMTNVVSLLSGESLTLPQPNGLVVSVGHYTNQMMASNSSVNDLTTSTIVPR